MSDTIVEQASTIGIPKPATPLVHVFTWRGSQHKYRAEYNLAYAKLFVKEVVFATQSESDGNISITLFYR